MKIQAWTIGLLLLAVGFPRELRGNAPDDERVATSTPNEYDFLLGTYEGGEDTASIRLTIGKEGGKYTYHLVSARRNLEGYAEIQEGEDNLWVVLPDVKWDDYQGDLTNGNRLADADDAAEPNKDENLESEASADVYGVDLFVDRETGALYMQNYGNAMNYYVIFSECDVKHILWEKK